MPEARASSLFIASTLFVGCAISKWRAREESNPRALIWRQRDYHYLTGSKLMRLLVISLPRRSRNHRILDRQRVRSNIARKGIVRKRCVWLRIISVPIRSWCDWVCHDAPFNLAATPRFELGSSDSESDRLPVATCRKSFGPPAPTRTEKPEGDGF
jgi:hypothetical protein